MSAQRNEGARAWEDVSASTEAAELAYGQSGHHSAAEPDYYGYSQGHGRDDEDEQWAELTGWHRTAAVLMGFGAFAAATIGFIIFGLVVLCGGQDGVPGGRTPLWTSPQPSATTNLSLTPTESEMPRASVPTSPSVSALIPTATVAAPSSTSPATTLVPTTEASAPDTTTAPSTQTSATATTTSRSSEPSPPPIGPPPPQGPLVLPPPRPRLGP